MRHGIEVRCPHCKAVHHLEALPKDKGLEVCGGVVRSGCRRGFEVLPDGSTQPTPLDQVIGFVYYEEPGCFSTGRSVLNKG